MGRGDPVEDLVRGKHFIPFRCTAPWLLCFTMYVSSAGRGLLSTTEFTAAVSLNIFDDMAVHREIVDSLLHGDYRIVLVLEEVDE